MTRTYENALAEALAIVSDFGTDDAKASAEAVARKMVDEGAQQMTELGLRIELPSRFSATGSPVAETIEPFGLDDAE